MGKVKEALEELSHRMGYGGVIDDRLIDSLYSMRGTQPMRHITLRLESSYVERAEKHYPNLTTSEALRQTIRCGLTAIEQMKGDKK